MSGCSRDCGRRARLGRFAPAVAFLALVAITGAPVRAADIEKVHTRDFVVTVAGKPAGEVHMTIRKEDDGSYSVNSDTDIKVNLVVGSYKFIYRGRELWKNGRLARLDSNTDDNGKRYILSAVAGPASVAVKVNNVEKQVRSDVWLTSYWMLPDPKLRGNPLTILDADNGKVMTARLAYVATEKRRIAGQEITLNRYRLTGEVNMDLWYDGSERLVRQEWVEQGHRTIVELSRVRR